MIKHNSQIAVKRHAAEKENYLQPAVEAVQLCFEHSLLENLSKQTVDDSEFWDD